MRETEKTGTAMGLECEQRRANRHTDAALLSAIGISAAFARVLEDQVSGAVEADIPLGASLNCESATERE